MIIELRLWNKLQIRDEWGQNNNLIQMALGLQNRLHDLNAWKDR